MGKRNTKKIVMAITTAVVAAGAAVLNVIPVFAEPGKVSRSSIVVNEGEIVLDTADIDMLQKELGGLEAELPDTSKQPYYGTARKSRVNSKGIIDYANKTVVIDASDFAYLADEIDMLESAYKANTASALNTMGTSFLADGSISHEPSDEGISGAEAVRLSFDTLISGILQSQSVDHLAEQGIAGAIKDNLSKGTAAWVNGKLIIGNGADNDAYYENGYNKGCSDGYNDGYNKGVSDGYNKGVSDGHADVIANPGAYGISTAPKVFCFNDGFNYGGETSYTCPADGVYTFVIRVSYNNNHAHNNLSNGVYLKIGSETLTIFHHYYDYNNFNFETVGDIYYIDTRTCAAGTVITLDVSAPYFNDADGDYAYTCASMVIY